MVGRLLIGLALVGLTAGAVWVTGDEDDATPGRASKDLGDLHPAFRLRVDQLLQDLRAQGYVPKIRETWRSPERQAYYHRMGWSQVDRSYHTVTGPDGRPEALALDCHDGRYEPVEAAANVPNQARFFKALRQAAPRYGLRTGGTWSRSSPTWAPYDLGWDPGHVEPDWSGSVAAAHDRGLRPFVEG